MKGADDRNLRERALRLGADRICLWRLCGKAGCLRARGCRGDARVCAGLMRDWLEALDAEKRARRSFADIERPLSLRKGSGPIAPGARRSNACADLHSSCPDLIASMPSGLSKWKRK